MIFDRLNEFSDSQDFTATGNTVSTNVIDLGEAGDAYGREMYLVVQVPVAVTSGGAATVTVTLETDDNEAIASAKDLYVSEAFAIADMSEGSQLLAVRIPQGCQQYLRISYAVGVAVLTAGAFDAFLAAGPQANDFTTNAQGQPA